MEGPQRLISSLDLPPEVIGTLAACGYIRVQDLLDVTVNALSHDLGVTCDEAGVILLRAHTCMDAPGRVHDSLRPTSILDLIQAHRQSPPVITFCKAVDTMLGGGVRRGQMTEFYGMPASGKTHVCMQLALDVQIPQSFGGADGTSVYLDTEGSFMAERMSQMADAFLAHLNRIAKSGDNAERKQAVSRLNKEVVLSNIHVFRILDDGMLLSVMEMLPDFLDRHPEVKIVVIDSLAFHLRQDTDFQTESNVDRAFILGVLGRELNKMAHEKQVAVVVTNQMTTKVEGDRSTVIPTLGEAWAPFCTTRVALGTGSMLRIRHEAVDKVLRSGSNEVLPGARPTSSPLSNHLFLTLQRVHAVATLTLVYLDATMHAPTVYRRPVAEGLKVLGYLAVTFTRDWDIGVYVRLLCLWAFLSGMSGLAIPLKLLWTGRCKFDLIALAIIMVTCIGLGLTVGVVSTTIARKGSTHRRKTARARS